MRSHYSNEITPELDKKPVTLAGWVHEIRDHGNLKFLILRDRGGTVQITAKKDTTDKKVLDFFDKLAKESVVEINGIVKRDNKAPKGVEIVPIAISIIAESKSPLPLDVTGKVDADLDTRLNNRFMDLRKREIAAIFRIRSKVQSSFREYFLSRSFVEINPPCIIAAASEGGTNLFPISYFEKEAYLAQSPQLYKQMMMATGLDRVFITMPVFRAEPHHTTRHLNEVYQMDIEKAFIKDEEDVLDELEGVVQYILKKVAEDCTDELGTLKRKVEVPKLPFRRFTYDEILDMLHKNDLEIKWGEDLTPDAEKILNDEIKTPFFIKHWPTKMRAFYSKPLDENPEISHAFDLDYGAMELASGAQRIHDEVQLVEALKSRGLNPENFEFYLKAFRYGMPPHGGWSIGAERITEVITGVTNIRECVLYPRDRTRLAP